MIEEHLINKCVSLLYYLHTEISIQQTQIETEIETYIPKLYLFGRESVYYF